MKFAQFRLTANRVTGMLSMLRQAIAADNSDWPLTEVPEDLPAAAEPEEVRVVAPPDSHPAQELVEAEPDQTAGSETQPELDVRPWSAGAPWRAAEPPAVTVNWSTRLADRLNDLGLAISSSIAPLMSRVRSAGAATSKAAMRRSRAAGAALLEKSARATHATRTAALATVERSSRAARNWRPGEQLQTFRGRLNDAASVAKRASSTVLCTVVPAEPTSSDIRMLLGITTVLLVALVAFSYRDKFTASKNSFGGSTAIEFNHRETPAEPNATPDETPARIVKARRSSPMPARLDTGRTESPVITRTSTPELATALAFLDDSRGERDPARAAQWLWAAARKGDTSANILLADLYTRGDGVPQNCAQARVLLLAASQKGNEEATRKLQEFDAGGCGSTPQ